MKKFMLCVLAATTLSLYASEEKAKSTADKAETPRNAARDSATSSKGMLTYSNECAMCHGNRGRGDGDAASAYSKAPTDLTSTATAMQPDEMLFRIITKGRKPMPAYARTLSEEERWSVVKFMRTFAAPIVASKEKNK